MNTNPLNFLKDRIVAGRKMDEAFYELALREFQSGSIRPGLMAKAMAECNGNELKARAAYVRLLATALRDDYYIAHRSQEDDARNAERLRSQQEAARAKELEEAKKTASKAAARYDFWDILKIIALTAWVGWMIYKPSVPSKQADVPVAPMSQSKQAAVGSKTAIDNVNGGPPPRPVVKAHPASDATACLGLATNRAIARCTDQYR